jgi:hypothetical protein
MGSAKKIMMKVATESGIIKKVPKVLQPLAKAGAELEAGRDPTDKAAMVGTPEQRADAARRRARRSGRRGLMTAGRLGGGGGGQAGEEKNTLGSA